MIGRVLGPYQVVAKLGEGGMGEVYRARDAKLGRDVALKILPESFASDPDRLMRFEREAKTLAALNHPNIAQVYGLEGDGSVRPTDQTRPPGFALVMELVEGEDLSERIARGPVDLEDALPIARQIAEALEAAHEAGIIHRDLKPANIKVRADGTVKVLDFGLAKGVEGDGSGSRQHGSSPSTMTSPALTAMGLILGTAAYMSPEQAKGRPVDRRADIWAFGVVLYEMLTGERCFKGEDISETLASVLKDRPALDQLPSTIPPPLRRLLERCLDRDPTQRLRDIGEARILLQKLQAGDADDAAPHSSAATPVSSGRLASWLGAAVLVGLAMGWTAYALVGAPAPEAGSNAPMRVTVEAFPGLGNIRNPAPAPDDRFVVYEGLTVDSSILYVHDFESGTTRALPGTEGGGVPFLSPDGRWVGFRRGADLMKVRLAGGDAIKICDAPGNFPGAAWTPDNRIVFPLGWLQGLSSVSADGGEPVPLTTVNTDAGEKGHWWPRLLPDGRHALITIWNAGAGLIDSEIAVVDLETGDHRTLFRGSDAWFLPPGHIVYYHAGSYQGIAFDAGTLEVAGEPVPVLEDATDPEPQGSVWIGVAISARGTLFYLKDKINPPTRLAVVAPGVAAQPLAFTPRAINGIALSPDGQRIAVGSLESGVFRIRLLDLESGTDDRVDLPGSNWNPYWQPDGGGFAFLSMRKGDFDVYYKAIGADIPEEPIRTTPTDEWPMGWSAPDGAFLFTETQPDGTQALKMRPRRDGNEESTLIPNISIDTLSVSPDGRWLAYDATRDGRMNVYVRPFSPSGQESGVEVRVSPNGGQQAAWSPDGTELYYVHDDSIVAVPYTTTEDRFRPGAEEVLFTSSRLDRGGTESPLVVRGRRSFIVGLRDDEPGLPRLHVVLNWSREVAARLAAR